MCIKLVTWNICFHVAQYVFVSHLSGCIQSCVSPTVLYCSSIQPNIWHMDIALSVTYRLYLTQYTLVKNYINTYTTTHCLFAERVISVTSNTTRHILPPKNNICVIMRRNFSSVIKKLYLSDSCMLLCTSSCSVIPIFRTFLKRSVLQCWMWRCNFLGGIMIISHPGGCTV